MAKRHFADWLSAYMEFTQPLESPDKFHFWTGVSTIAGALRRRVFITKINLFYEWTPNFYIIFVAPPGIISKTTTAEVGMELLKKVPGVHFGPSAVTWQRLVSKFNDCRTTIEWPDGTTSVMSPMTIVSSELGNLLDFRDKQMIDNFVNFWDCKKDYMKSTKKEGDEELEYPWLNILGCTTPDWIAGNVPEYLIGGGFTSRCVFVYGERKRRLVAYPGLETNPEGYQTTKTRLIEDLTQMSNLLGEVEFTPGAIKWGREWYESHNAQAIEPDAAVAGYMARKQTHMHKLAMILAVSRGDDLVIDEGLLDQSKSILEAAEGDMAKVFAHVGMTPETRAMEQLVRMVRAAGNKGINKSAAYRVFARFLSSTTFDEVIKSALATGRIRQGGSSVAPQLVPGVGP